MPEIPEAFDHMLAAWNERDPARVRAHLEKALSPEVVFIDPSIVTKGIDLGGDQSQVLGDDG